MALYVVAHHRRIERPLEHKSGQLAEIFRSEYAWRQEAQADCIRTAVIGGGMHDTAGDNNVWPDPIRRSSSATVKVMVPDRP